MLVYLYWFEDKNHFTILFFLGHYAFIDASNVQIGAQSRLVSPVYRNPRSYDICMHFFYYMYGSGVGTLNVYVKVR